MYSEGRQGGPWEHLDLAHFGGGRAGQAVLEVAEGQDVTAAAAAAAGGSGC